MLASERVIVFEIAGSVSDFVKAINRIPSFEFMLEQEIEQSPDDLFERTSCSNSQAVR